MKNKIKLNDPKHIFIIAEAGSNWKAGSYKKDIERAEKLIKVAAKSGADAIKFQTFKAETLVSKSASKAAYQKKATDSLESQFNMIKRLELNVDAHKELIKYCDEKGIIFLSAPFDIDSINLLNTFAIFLGPIGRAGRPENPYPGREGVITSNASTSFPPKRSG